MQLGFWRWANVLMNELDEGVVDSFKKSNQSTSQRYWWPSKISSWWPSLSLRCSLMSWSMSSSEETIGRYKPHLWHKWKASLKLVIYSCFWLNWPLICFQMYLSGKYRGGSVVLGPASTKEKRKKRKVEEKTSSIVSFMVALNGDQMRICLAQTKQSAESEWWKSNERLVKWISVSQKRESTMNKATPNRNNNTCTQGLLLNAKLFSQNLFARVSFCFLSLSCGAFLLRKQWQFNGNRLPSNSTVIHTLSGSDPWVTSCDSCE